MAKPQLRINTFGRTEILSREGPISGTWLDGRAGQLLKYMLVERDRVVRTDEIVENVWRGSDGGGASSVRFYIHELRRHLEPDRAPRAASFLVWKRGGYQFDLDRVQIDANDFERDVNYGLRAFRAGNLEEATTELEAGLDLYHGDFLADEAYADWVLVERDRLRSLAVEALEAIAEAYLRHGTTQSAIGPLTRLAEFQPFDSEMQRKLLCALLADGRRTDAMRRYEIFRRRLKREFGEEPEFALGDLAVSQRS
jgi:DNA-binding SARP family transcriptional activator